MIKNRIRHIFFFSVSMFFSVPIFGAVSPWYLEREEDNIDVYLAKVKGSTVKTFSRCGNR